MAAYKKILVLLDLAQGSEQVAMAARDLAAYSAAAMIVRHVVEFVPVEPVGESLIKRARSQLGELTARLAPAGASWRVEAGGEFYGRYRPARRDLRLVGGPLE